MSTELAEMYRELEEEAGADLLAAEAARAERELVTLEDDEAAELDPDEVRLQYQELEIVLKAFADVGANRMPLATPVALHNRGKPFREANREYGELTNAVLAPYLRDGEQGIKSDHPDFAAIVAKLEELGRTVVTIQRNGPPVDLTPFLPDEQGKTPSSVTISCEPRYLTVLADLRLVRIEPDPNNEGE